MMYSPFTTTRLSDRLCLLCLVSVIRFFVIVVLPLASNNGNYVLVTVVLPLTSNNGNNVLLTVVLSL